MKSSPPYAEGAVEGIDISKSREEEDRRLGTSRKRPDPFARGEAVHFGHADVEKNAVGALCLEGSDPLGTARREDDAVAFVFEDALRERAVGLDVIDDENRGDWRTCGTFCRSECFCFRNHAGFTCDPYKPERRVMPPQRCVRTRRAKGTKRNDCTAAQAVRLRHRWRDDPSSLVAWLDSSMLSAPRTC